MFDYRRVATVLKPVLIVIIITACCCSDGPIPRASGFITPFNPYITLATWGQFITLQYTVVYIFIYSIYIYYVT